MDQKQKVIVRVSEPTRINKYLAQAGLRSRRETDALIDARQILLNGELLTEQGCKVLDGDVIELLTADTPLTIILYKPIGYISDQFSSTTHEPAIKLITKSNSIKTYSDDLYKQCDDLHVLGRLDADSHGLLVFSNSGVIAKQLIGPESPVDKEYVVKVRGEITQEKINLLISGITLDGQRLKTAIVTQENDNTLRFILREGKNRQIRRMCEKVDLLVLDLLRVRIGHVHLANLPEGKWRILESTESFI